MPWSHPSPMDQNPQLIADYLRDRLSLTERCPCSHRRRPTGYKWMARYLRYGPAGVDERSRTPTPCPRQTPAAGVAAMIEARRQHPAWGAKRRLAILPKRHPPWPWPARATLCAILSRNGLVPRKRRRRRRGHPGKPATSMRAPPQLGTADFPGQGKTGDGRYGAALTVADGYSRFLPACPALRSTAVHAAKPLFTRVGHEFGLPPRLRTDHGVPFATTTLARRAP